MPAPPQQQVQVQIIPRFEIRRRLTCAEAKLARIRADLLDTAADLAVILAQAALSEHMLRAASLGIVPPHIDGDQLPRPEDMAELRAAVAAVTALADDVARVTTPPAPRAAAAIV